MARSETARDWLRQNDYDDIVEMIDDIMTEWRAAGKKTRRNWWRVLAGRRDGSSCVYAGRTFPVLQAAQLRAGLAVTPNAIARSDKENVPAVWQTPRWSKEKKGEKD